MNPGQRTRFGGGAGALMIAFGLGVALWYGWDWYHIPKWSEQEIQNSVELNLQLDLARLGESAVSQAEKNRLRESIRLEVEAEIAKETEKPRGYTYAGLMIAVLGLVQMQVRRWLMQ